MANEVWKIKFIKDWDEINSLEFQDLWLRWSQTSLKDNVFFHPKIAIPWVNAYSKIWGISPMYALAENGKTVVFFPLVKIEQNIRSFYRKIIAPVGFSSYDYCDPLILGEDTCHISGFYPALINALKKEMCDWITFKGLHNSEPGSHFVKSGEEKCYYVNLNELDDGFNTLLFQMSSKNRREHLRVERRLNELGKITFEVMKNGNSSVDDEINKFILNYKLRWPNAFFAADFHKELIFTGLQNNLLWFSLLRLDERTIGWAIDLVWKGKCYAYMHVYDRELISYAPGRTHLAERIKLALSARLNTFDLLTGSEMYKSEWFRDFDTIYSFEMKSQRFTSILKNGMNSFKHKVSR